MQAVGRHPARLGGIKGLERLGLALFCVVINGINFDLAPAITIEQVVVLGLLVFTGFF